MAGKRGVIVTLLLARCNALLKKYSDVPMSLADGCLVRLAENYPQSLILTVDSDFNVYRKNGTQLIPCISPL